MGAKYGVLLSLNPRIARYATESSYVNTITALRRGGKVTTQAVTATAGHWKNWKEVMALLLDRRGYQVTITDVVVKAAARNWNVKVMMALLDHRGDQITITNNQITLLFPDCLFELKFPIKIESNGYLKLIS